MGESPQIPTPLLNQLLEECELLGRASSMQELHVLAANALSALTRSGQVLLWKMSIWGKPELVAIAGLTQIQRHNDLTNWFEGLARVCLISGTDEFEELPTPIPDPHLEAQRGQYLFQHTVHGLLRDKQQAVIGGVFLSKSTPWTDVEIWIARKYGQALCGHLGHFLIHQFQWDRVRQRVTSRYGVIGVALGLVGILCMPVHLRAIASVEITARDARPITASQDGVIEKVMVRPNQEVTAGQVLVLYDGAVVRNRLEVARQNVFIMQAELDRSVGKAFEDDTSRNALRTLRARVQEKTAEMRYLQQLASRLEVVAPSAGLVIFSDAEEWVGRPLQMGERIMHLADRDKVWMTLLVAPEDAIAGMEQSQVKVNLDINPFESVTGQVRESSYEALPQPDGRIAYVLRARLDEGHAVPRIGLRGVATVYGERVSLGYFLFRKPMRVMQRFLGL